MQKNYQRHTIQKTGFMKGTGFLFILFYLLVFNSLSAKTEPNTSSNLTVLPSYGLTVYSTDSLQNVEERLVSQLEIYPQEKIHLHTDRDFYVSGEKIWFKAYVTDAVTLQHPTFSRYVYVELIDQRDSLVSRVMIRPENDMFHGHIYLTEIIPEGNYTLRAYTRYMENMGDDYFFKKNIRIGNLKGGNGGSRGNGGNWGSRGNRVVGANLAFAQNDFDVSFFPEGGNLVEGSICKVAFKALNRNGFPEIVSGMLINETGAELSYVQTWHAGMGMITYIPEQGKKYYLKCRSATGLEKQFELPRPNPRAYSLTTSFMSKRHIVRIQKSTHAPDFSCFLLVHCRGVPLYFSVWDKEKEYITFFEEQFPAGVIHFILFDDEMNPLSERLVFSKNYDDAKIAFHTDRTRYEKREKVSATLKVSSLLERTEGEGEMAGERWGHFSVAVTDDNDIQVDESTTIFSSLLLSSELKGYIENPAYYLQDDRESAIALDLLMMTHGWRRYPIPEVVKGNPEYPTIPFQLSQEISGKVKSYLLSRPVTNSEISILTKEGDFGITSTGENGTFIFDDFEYPDSTSFFIQALSRRGSSMVELVLDGESFPKLIHAPQSPYLTPALSKGEGESEPNAFIAKAEQRAKYDEDMWVIQLGEVEVTARRIERQDEPRLEFWANMRSNVTIRREAIVNRSPILVSDMLRGIVGVEVSPSGKIFIRGGSAGFQGGTLPLVFIDGVPVSWPEILYTPYDSPLEQVNVHNVESIDVIKGAGAAQFGMRGMGGAISITTRRGGSDNSREREEFNYTVYTPLGYQKPVEFYSPKYETIESKHLTNPDYRTTIFWKPDVVISDAGEASFDFYTSDFQTTYSVVIEGLTTDGRIVRQVETIRVE